MANTNKPFGLRPVRYLNGTPWTGAARHYYVPASYGTALYVGDPVVGIGEANQAEYMGFVPGSLPVMNIGVASTTVAITGVIVGFLPTNRDSLVYRPASVEAIALVVDDPNVVFQVQDDGGGALTYDTVGLNGTLIAGAGSTVTGRSGWALDGGTTNAPAATATNQLLILAVSNLMNNEISDYAIWDVKLNNTMLAVPAALGVA